MAGPKYFTGASSRTWYMQRMWYTQAKPYVNPLPYRYLEGYQWPNEVGPGNASFYCRNYADSIYGIGVNAFNKCSQKFYDAMGEGSTWTVNLKERESAISMITRRAKQLLDFSHAVRRLDFGAAARLLGVKTPKGVSRHKQFGNNWLEYHFGWEPLIKDIGAAVDLLQNPIPDRHIKVRARSFVEGVKGRIDTDTESYKESNAVSIRAGARVEISNPDLYAANRLGFTNPALVAWEVIPFSFVVDWFIPVGSFLSGMQATLGLRLHGPWWSERSTYYRETKHHGIGPGGEHYNYDYGGSGVWAERHDTAISPYPLLPTFRGFSPVRGLTAISLLLQGLHK